MKKCQYCLKLKKMQHFTDDPDFPDTCKKCRKEILDSEERACRKYGLKTLSEINEQRKDEEYFLYG